MRRYAHLRWGLMGENLRFEDGRFTHVFMSFGIMLVPDYMAALRGMYRVLRPGGVVAITCWKCQGHWDVLVRAVREVLRDKSYPPPQFWDKKWASGKEVSKMLSKAGFRYGLGWWC
jgi:ubiquinone/menaquinone biosynthesis C-methylase UbiE